MLYSWEICTYRILSSIYSYQASHNQHILSGDTDAHQPFDDVGEMLRQDYIMTAHAKGLAEEELYRNLQTCPQKRLYPGRDNAWYVLWCVVRRLDFNRIYFSGRGWGRYAVKAITFLDFPTVMGVTVVIAFLFVIINLLVDFLYYFLDPHSLRLSRKHYVETTQTEAFTDYWAQGLSALSFSPRSSPVLAPYDPYKIDLKNPIETALRYCNICSARISSDAIFWAG